MSGLKIPISKEAAFALSRTDGNGGAIKITLSKEEIIPVADKGVLKKTQVSLTLEKYNNLKLCFPAFEGLINYYVCSNQF